jgi:hypothetical protein
VIGIDVGEPDDACIHDLSSFGAGKAILIGTRASWHSQKRYRVRHDLPDARTRHGKVWRIIDYPTKDEALEAAGLRE